MSDSIVAQDQPHLQHLQALRARLFLDLRALEALPQHELKRRYYEIQPQLRHVCRELSVGINRNKRTKKMNIHDAYPSK